MKRLILIATLLLAACGQQGTISGPEIIAAIKSTCGIIVPIADIAALVGTQTGVVTVASIAAEICGAIAAHAQAAPSGPPVTGAVIINGVLIHYQRRT